MTDLKPCPFCGGAVALSNHGCITGSDTFVTMYWVQCDNCGTEGPEGFSATSAATAWNTRTPPRVKELVWEDLSNDDGGWLRANIEFNHDYSLMSYSDKTWGVFTSFKTSKGYSGCQGKGFTLADAKAAAQADYEKRILEALE